MTDRLPLYEALAVVFDRPGPARAQEIQRTAEALRPGYSDAAEALDAFVGVIGGLASDAFAELHVRTFDIQPIATLDLGYTLFGEDYKRGALLAGLVREHREQGVDCGGELADHLPNVLRLLGRLPDGEVRTELVTVVLAPALENMLREFDPTRLVKKEEVYRKHHKTLIEYAEHEQRTAYRFALEALRHMLKRDFTIQTRRLPVAQEGSFERALDTEMDIESCGPCGPTA